MLRDDGVEIARGTTVWAFVRTGDLRTMRITAAVRASFDPALFGDPRE